MTGSVTGVASGRRGWCTGRGRSGEPIGPRCLDRGVQSLSPISASALITTSTVTSTGVQFQEPDQASVWRLGGGAAGVALLVGSAQSSAVASLVRLP